VRKLIASILVVCGFALSSVPALACEGLEKLQLTRYAIHAADAATTIYVIEKKNGREGNPLAKLFIGKHLSPGEVIAFKAVHAGIQTAIACKIYETDPKAARLFERINIVITGGVVAANLRFVF